MKENFDEVNIEQIPRDENLHIDALANLSSVTQVTEVKNIPLIYLKWPAVWKQDQETTYDLSIEITWMNPIFDYLQNNVLPKKR